MKRLVFSFFLVAMGVWFGCATQTSQPIEQKVEILYYDRNGDGKVDLEKHNYPGTADMNWELRDDDFNGRYETKVLYGFAVTKSKVDLPVPTGVRIEAKE